MLQRILAAAGNPSSTMRISPDCITVEFCLSYPISEASDTLKMGVRVLGNIPELGNNILEKAPKMTYDAVSKQWKLQIEVPKDANPHYRYIIHDQTSSSEFTESAMYRGLSMNANSLTQLPFQLKVNDKWQDYDKSQRQLPKESEYIRQLQAKSAVGDGDPRIDEWLALRTELSASSQDMEIIIHQRVTALTEDLQTQNTRLATELQSLRRQLKTVEEECLKAKLDNATLQSEAADREKDIEQEKNTLQTKISSLEQELTAVQQKLDKEKQNSERETSASRIAKSREESALSTTEAQLVQARAEIFVKQSSISTLQRQLETVRERNMELEKEQHKHLADLWKARDASQVARKELQEIDFKLSASSHALLQKNSQIRKLQSDLHNQSEAVKSKDRAHEEAKQSLEKKLQVATEQNNNLLEAIEELKEQIRSLKVQISSQKRRTTLSRLSFGGHLGSFTEDADDDDILPDNVSIEENHENVVQEDKTSDNDDTQLLLQVAGRDIGNGMRLPDAQALRDLLEADQRAESLSLQLSEMQSRAAAAEKLNEERIQESTQWEGEASQWKQKAMEIQSENRTLFNQILELKGNIRVFARIRPLLSHEETETETTPSVIAADADMVVVHDKVAHHDGSNESRKLFRFDRVFGDKSSQEDVYEEVQRLVRSVVDGYTVCIFAYGQTGSGKTFTMQGTPKDPGINTRAFGDLFDLVNSRADTHQCTVSASMLEIYNENVRDLLSPSTDKSSRGLQVRQDPKRGAFVEGLSERVVCDLHDVDELLEFARGTRTVASTSMNDVSSRSHMIMQIHVTSKNLLTDKTSRSTLYLIDLAGSERIKRSEAEGKALKEAQHINKSLSALGDVMSALQSKQSHIPFRNSKLTQLLMNALGGPNKALMMVNLSPTSDSVQESVCSLQFASRTAKVELGAADQHTTGGSNSAKLAKEIKALRAQLCKAEQTARDAIVSSKHLKEELKAVQEGAEEERESWCCERARLEFELNSIKSRVLSGDTMDDFYPNEMKNNCVARSLDKSKNQANLQTSNKSNYTIKTSNNQTNFGKAVNSMKTTTPHSKSVNRSTGRRRSREVLKNHEHDTHSHSTNETTAIRTTSRPPSTIKRRRKDIGTSTPHKNTSKSHDMPPRTPSTARRPPSSTMHTPSTSVRPPSSTVHTPSTSMCSQTKGTPISTRRGVSSSLLRDTALSAHRRAAVQSSANKQLSKSSGKNQSRSKTATPLKATQNTPLKEARGLNKKSNIVSQGKTSTTKNLSATEHAQASVDVSHVGDTENTLENQAPVCYTDDKAMSKGFVQKLCSSGNDITNVPRLPESPATDLFSDE